MKNHPGKPHRFSHRAILLLLSLLPLNLLLLQPLSAQQFVDPTRPYTGNVSSIKRAADKPRQMQVQAIYRFNEQRLAIIDGVLVHEGDRLASLKIEKITDDHVCYVRNGISGVLRLEQAASSVKISSIRSEVTP